VFDVKTIVMKKILLGLLITMILVSCNQNSDRFEGFWLLKKRRNTILIKIVKVEDNVYEIIGPGELAFGIKKDDTIHCSTPEKNASIDDFYFNEKNELIFDGDPMEKLDLEKGNQILVDKGINDR
jgi:hypothetical protein